MYCGGFAVQFNSVNRGRCGLCGDEYSGLQHHMAGGTFASGTIARSYSQGQVIDIEIDLVANHLVRKHLSAILANSAVRNWLKKL